ncbi:MAG: hypothetical protein JWL90_80 [Chthoniobacteraceae bacterium]|nr:hypothetical protein [Chthoniobacteraceae bacterium]
MNEREWRKISTREVWMWRIGIWVLASTCSIAFFHWHIGFPSLVPAFGLVSYKWLLCEIEFYRERQAWAFLKWAGKWSYSVYATHLIIPDLLSKLPLTPITGSLGWMLRIVLVMAGCYAFYLLAFASPCPPCLN